MSLHFDQVKNDSFESFSEESFRALLYGLSTNGYVLDFVEVAGTMFAAKQIEYLDQEMFKELCNKFANNSVTFMISSTGAFFEGHGNMYIAYNKNLFTHEDAWTLLNESITNLDI